MTGQRSKPDFLLAFGEYGLDLDRYFYLVSDGVISCELSDYNLYTKDVVEALAEHYKGHYLFSHLFNKRLPRGEAAPRIYSHILTLSDRMVVKCSEDDKIYLKLTLYYDGCETALQEYLSVIEPFRMNTPKNNFYMVVNKGGDLTLEYLEATHTEVDIGSHYNDDFGVVHEQIDEFLVDERSGLVILHGKQGTGKTSYIRSIIRRHTKKKVIFMNGDMVSEIASPGFVPFMIRQQNSIVVIEDCEELLSPRGNGGGVNSGLINILNMSDGLLGDALKLKFICTFNAPLKSIDQALLRKGRLIARYEFGDLAADKANAIIKKSGLDVPLQTVPISLAELYNYEKPSFEQQRRKPIGF